MMIFSFSGVVVSFWVMKVLLVKKTKAISPKKITKGLSDCDLMVVNGMSGLFQDALKIRNSFFFGFQALGSLKYGEDYHLIGRLIYYVEYL